jgi:hypothetical protein
MERGSGGGWPRVTVDLKVSAGVCSHEGESQGFQR